MNSIRKHLTLLLLLGSGILAIGGGFIAYSAVRTVVLSEFDYSLRTKVRDFAALTDREDGRYELEFVEKNMPEFERHEHPEYFLVRLHNGEIIARSPSLGSADLALPDAPPSAEPMNYSLMLPDGVPGRAAAEQVLFDGERLDVIVARDTVRLHRLFHSMATGFSVGTLLLLLGLALGLKHLVGKGLNPLETFAEQVDSIDEEALKPRFFSLSLPLELRPIALQLDRLLERIATALQRERDLTAAMAHELYTPIAELRSAAEVALKWPGDPGAAPLAVEEAHAIALQMQGIVNALLSLSRCEAGLQEINTEPVDLAELLTQVCGGVEESLRARKIAMTWALAPELIVQTDLAMLGVVLTNLFRNAADYTPTGGVMECRAEAVANNFVIALSNTQQGLSETDIAHLFEPLWRKDKARTGTAHSGLGLAVSKRICNQLGMQLTASLSEPGLFQISLAMPTGEPDIQDEGHKVADRAEE